MHAPQLSLKSLLLMCVYFAICSMVYVHPSLWIGVGVVLATIVWLAWASVHAFRSRNTFSLAFAIGGWSWIVFWFGFAVDTPPGSPPWQLGQRILKVVTVMKPPPEYKSGVRLKTFGALESLYDSGDMGTQTDSIYVPAFHNAIRLAVCLSGLFVGLLSGVVTKIFADQIAKKRQLKPDGDQSGTVPLR